MPQTQTQTAANGQHDPFPAPRSKSLAAILYDLRQPVPKGRIRQKEVKDSQTGKVKYRADYVPHTTIRDMLDYYAPGWESHSTVYEANGRLYVRLDLTIHGSDGSITRTNVGCEDSDLDAFGDPSSNAHAMALRRCAMDFGLGRDLWRKG